MVFLFNIVFHDCDFCLFLLYVALEGTDVNSLSQPASQTASQTINQSISPASRLSWGSSVGISRQKKKNMRRIDYVITFNAFIKNICTKIPLMLAVGCEVIWFRLWSVHICLVGNMFAYVEWCVCPLASIKMMFWPNIVSVLTQSIHAFLRCICDCSTAPAKHYFNIIFMHAGSKKSIIIRYFYWTFANGWIKWHSVTCSLYRLRHSHWFCKNRM